MVASFGFGEESVSPTVGKIQVMDFLLVDILFKFIINDILIGGMVGIDHRNEVPMVSIVAYMVIHHIEPKLSCGIRL